MASRTFHIDAALADASLAQAIKQLVPHTSWAHAKKLIANRHVQVHGNLCLDDGRRLGVGDVVKVFDEPLAKPPAPEDVAIVFRDAHLVVVEKPAGVTTQREARDVSEGRNQKQATLDELLNAALARLPRIVETVAPGDPPAQRAASDFILKHRSDRDEPRRAAKPAPPRVRPVHRLDRDTSGLIVFALTPEAEQKFVAMFKAHAVERLYRAVVVGRVERPMTIESFLVRDRGDGLRGSSDDAHAPDRQRAVTHVRSIEFIGDGNTVVECRLETGRTHQIRIHLAERGHMLCGEKTYVRPAAGARPTRDDGDAPRHALHSATLAFKHPITGRPLRFERDWPRDLARWLGRLRSA